MGGIVELNHVIVKHYLAVLRNKDTLPACFGEALDRLGMFLAIELTRGLGAEDISVETPLALTSGKRITGKLAVVPILRAGLALVQPFRELLPEVVILHLGMYRDEQSATPVSYYNKLEMAPDIESAIVVDPMLATGGSAIAAIKALQANGIEKISLGCVIAAPEGVARLQQEFPEVAITTCSIDERLDENHYILPGLGDAGDRYFGTV